MLMIMIMPPNISEEITILIVGCIPNDMIGMCWFSEMPLSVVDALLTEPLLLLKAEEVNANWDKEFLSKNIWGLILC